MTMKNRYVALAALSLSLLACTKEEAPGPPIQCTLLGRWEAPFNVLYEFTDSLQYTLYAENGSFGTITPNAVGKPWELRGDTLYIHHSSTSISKAVVAFDCDCNVMRTTASFSPRSITINTHVKEGFDLNSCQ